MFTAGNAETITQTLGGALYVPDARNCWRDAGRATPCTYDTKVYLMDDLTGAFTASQPTSTSQPYLRSGNYSDLPFVSGESVATYGPELVTNGAFDTATGWVLNSGTGSATISGGTANVNSIDGSFVSIYASPQFTIQNRGVYRLEYDVTSSTGMGVRIDFAGSTGPSHATTGHKVHYITATNTSSALSVVRGGGGISSGSIDNISVKLVTGASCETWTTTRTMIDASGGIEWNGADAYWRNSAGTTGNYASTPDSAEASITGDGTWIFDGALTDWTPTGIVGLVSKISGTTGEFGLSVLTDGTLQLTWYVAGVAKTATSTAAIGATDAAGCAIKVVRTIGVKVQFYKATDFNRATRTGTWVQIGSDVANTDAAATDTANAVLIGALTTAANPAAGKIHYAAAWANTTGTGMPSWEFYPARDAVKPASPWLDFDGTNDYLISSIIPGNYAEGFVCAGAVQTEALSIENTIFGNSANTTVAGFAIRISGAGHAEMVRRSGAAADVLATDQNITVFTPFVHSAGYSGAASATTKLNSNTTKTSAVSCDPRGGTQFALIGTANTVSSGVTPSTQYAQDHIHALVWLPVIPTEAQETAIRSYIASKARVTL